jgi:hypothetical protein
MQKNKIISKNQTVPVPPVQQSIHHYPVYGSGLQGQRKDWRITLNCLPAPTRNLGFWTHAWGSMGCMTHAVSKCNCSILLDREASHGANWVLSAASESWKQDTKLDLPLLSFQHYKILYCFAYTLYVPSTIKSKKKGKVVRKHRTPSRGSNKGNEEFELQGPALKKIGRFRQRK